MTKLQNEARAMIRDRIHHAVDAPLVQLLAKIINRDAQLHEGHGIRKHIATVCYLMAVMMFELSAIEERETTIEGVDQEHIACELFKAYADYTHVMTHLMVRNEVPVVWSDTLECNDFGLDPDATKH